MTLVYGSLFSGAGGFDLGFEAAGWRCAWQVEIDQVCQAVLRRHWPGVPKFLDVRDCGAANLAPVDAIVFGSPCQDLSVAGLRAGLEGERSGLFHEAIRIIRELRPTWAVWENVPGALSSVRGRDFGAALDALADSGALDIAWRVLDAQFWGVAQRRRRVFVVADFRGCRAAQVLFESESLRGDSAPGGTAGESLAGTLGSGAPGGGWRDDPERMTFVAFDRYNQTAGAQAGTLQAEARSNSQPTVLAGAVSAKWAKGTGGPAGDEAYNLVTGPLTRRHGKGINTTLDDGAIIAAPLTASMGKGIDRNGSHGGGPTNAIVAPLTASYGHHGRSSPRGDGSEPLVATFQQSSLAGRGTFGYDEDPTIAKPVKTQSDGQMIVQSAVEPLHIRCGCGRVYHGELDTVCPHCGLMQGGAVTYPPSRGGMTRQEKIDYANGIAPAAWDGVGITSKTNRSSVVPGAPAPTLNGSGLAALASPAVVRRLTPTECERLQGWPDSWTALRDDGTEIADGPRYRMIGNGVVAPLARWLAERLAAVAEGYPPERSVTTPNVPPPRPAERSRDSQPSMQTTTPAAASDHPSRSGPHMDDDSADRGTPLPQRRAQMAENQHRRPDPSFHITRGDCAVRFGAQRAK